MRVRFRLLAAFLLSAGFAPAPGAQMMQGPPRMRGVWSPVVGSGAAYQIESKREGKRDMEIAVVGKDTVEGQDGHWVEMVTKGRQDAQVVMKYLLVADAGQTHSLRWIVQQGDEQPIEFSMDAMGPMGAMRSEKPQEADIKTTAERVGSETITTPAGTFTCEHYRSADDGADIWVSDKVSPWGVVRMISKDTNMVLVRLLTNVQSKIKGTPKKFDFREMRRERPE